MSSGISDRIRQLTARRSMSVAEIARAAGLKADALKNYDIPGWEPSAEALTKLKRLFARNDASPVLVPIEEIFEEARNGRMYILVDDEDRENEGDLIIPAQMATPAAINFMALHGRGLICLALSGNRCDELRLEPMVTHNRESMGTGFTVSIEARDGVTTGISADDRARTVSVAINGMKGSEDIVTPGHVFPLRARDGGVLVRAGHTEASVDISRIVGLNPSAVICEIMRDDGTMARLDDLIAFAQIHGLKIGTIRDLIEYRRRYDHLVACESQGFLDSDYGGEWIVKTYRNKIDGAVTLVMQKGPIIPEVPALVRIHAVSMYDDVLGRGGAKKRILQRSMDVIGKNGAGVIVVLMPNSNEAIASEVSYGKPTRDLRDYGIGAQILADLGIQNLILLTNSDQHVIAIEGHGLSIVGRQSIP